MVTKNNENDAVLVSAIVNRRGNSGLFSPVEICVIPLTNDSGGLATKILVFDVYIGIGNSGRREGL